MMSACIVPNCHKTSNMGKKYRFHKFPKEGNPNFIRWLTAIGISYDDYKAALPWKRYVCSRHFDSEAYKKQYGLYIRKPNLKPEALPTLCMTTLEWRPVNPAFRLPTPPPVQSEFENAMNTAEEPFFVEIIDEQLQCEEPMGSQIPVSACIYDGNVSDEQTPSPSVEPMCLLMKVNDAQPELSPRSTRSSTSSRECGHPAYLQYVSEGNVCHKALCQCLSCRESHYLSRSVSTQTAITGLACHNLEDFLHQSSMISSPVSHSPVESDPDCSVAQYCCEIVQDSIKEEHLNQLQSEPLKKLEQKAPFKPLRTLSSASNSDETSVTRALETS